MLKICVLAFLGLVSFLILQLPLYAWLDGKIVSRREQPPLSDFGLVPIELSAGTDRGASICRQYCLDIVFVHGLGSNPDTTWQGTTAPTPRNDSHDRRSNAVKSSPVDWIIHLLPQDLQPQNLKSSQLFYFNYDSYWFRDALESQIDDLADKLIVDLSNLRRSAGKVGGKENHPVLN
ncbi:hypothetical protein BKA61DRAFT_147868 [Leptodontidium sp. MPI-SDFR-AT-0119]|nr:hypothetical protein BKA61DRAFT_147868 [Leptodontidium sp. MPI-SDFR-AT-0119]